MEANGFPYAVPTIVTTRGIGFSVSNFLRTYHSLNLQNNVSPDPYALYRIGLAALETRVSKARVGQGVATHFSDQLMSYGIHYEDEEAIMCLQLLPASLACIISSVGTFTHGNEWYIPRLVRNSTFIPSSENVYFSNLHETVEALANPDISPPVRVAFYKNNPIPGCIWSGAPDNPVLQNANVIMPSNYDTRKLHNDVSSVNRALCFVQTKLPEILSSKRLSELFDQPGSTSLLVSNEQNGLRQPDLVDQTRIEDYFKHLELDNNIEFYWSSRKIRRSKQLEGVLNLTGELPVLQNIVHSTYCGRNIRLAALHMNINYKSLVDIVTL